MLTDEDRFKTADPGHVRTPLIPPKPEEETRPRRWPWLLLALVLAVAITFFGTRFALDRHEVTVWQASQDIPPGSALSAGNLIAVRADSTQLAANTVQGVRPEGFARSGLPSGALVTEPLLSSNAPGLARGTVVLGLALTGAQVPSGDLAAGDAVSLWASPPTDQDGQALRPTSRPLAARLRVRVVDQGSEGALLISISLPRRLAPEASALAAQNRIVVTRAR